MLVEIRSKEELNNLLERNEKVLIDFYATWCGPCKMMEPVLKEVAEVDLVVVKVDVEQHPELKEEFAVMSVPTFVLMKDGERVWRETGYMPKDYLLEILQKE